MEAMVDAPWIAFCIARSRCGRSFSDVGGINVATIRTSPPRGEANAKQAPSTPVSNRLVLDACFSRSSCRRHRPTRRARLPLPRTEVALLRSRNARLATAMGFLLFAGPASCAEEPQPITPSQHKQVRRKPVKPAAADEEHNAEDADVEAQLVQTMKENRARDEQRAVEHTADACARTQAAFPCDRARETDRTQCASNDSKCLADVEEHHRWCLRQKESLTRLCIEAKDDGPSLCARSCAVVSEAILGEKCTPRTDDAQCTKANADEIVRCGTTRNECRARANSCDKIGYVAGCVDCNGGYQMCAGTVRLNPSHCAPETNDCDTRVDIWARGRCARLCSTR